MKIKVAKWGTLKKNILKQSDNVICDHIKHSPFKINNCSFKVTFIICRLEIITLLVVTIITSFCSNYIELLVLI